MGGGDLAWLQHPVTGGFAEFLRTNGFAIIRAFIDIPYKRELLDATGADMDAMEAAFWTLQDRVAHEPITLLHGDPHPRNTYVLQMAEWGSWTGSWCGGVRGPTTSATR